MSWSSDRFDGTGFRRISPRDDGLVPIIWPGATVNLHDGPRGNPTILLEPFVDFVSSRLREPWIGGKITKISITIFWYSDTVKHNNVDYAGIIGDKIKLGTFTKWPGVYMAPTYMVSYESLHTNGTWARPLGKSPPAPPSSWYDQPWYCKRNEHGGRGLYVLDHPDEAVAVVTKGTGFYIIQPSWPQDIMLIDGHKFSLRGYLVLAQRDRTLQAFAHQDGKIFLAKQPFAKKKSSRLTQVTNRAVSKDYNQFFFRLASQVPEVMELRVFHRMNKIFKHVLLMGKQRVAKTRLFKEGFELLAADFMIGADGALWLLEFTPNPDISSGMMWGAPAERNFLEKLSGDVHVMGKAFAEGRQIETANSWIECDVGKQMDW